MVAKIDIVVNGYPLGNPGEPEVHPYSVIESASPLVELSLTDTTGVTQYFWSFLSKPVGSTATIQNATSAVASFNPDVGLPGTYIVQCKLNNDESSVLTNGLGFETEFLGARIPSAHETDEFDSSIGWDGAMQDFMRKADEQIAAASETLWDRVDGTTLGGSGYYLSPGLSEKVNVPGGAVDSPSIVFEDDIDTGFWRYAEDILALSLGGTPGLQFVHLGPSTTIMSYDVEDANYGFGIGHMKTSSGLAAEGFFTVVGTADNAGATLDLSAIAGDMVGASEILIGSVGGLTSTIEISATNAAASDSDVQILSSTNGDATIGITCSGDGVGDSIIRIRCESDYQASALILGSKGGLGSTIDEGRVQIGEFDSGCVAFQCEQIDDSSWPQAYLYLAEDDSEVDAYYAAHGAVSILAAIASLGASFWQRTGTVLSPLTAGDTARVGAGSSSDVGLGFVGTDDTGFYQRATGEIGIALDGGSYAYLGLYGTTRSSFIGEEPIGLISFDDGDSNAFNPGGDVYVSGMRLEPTPEDPSEAYLWMEAYNAETINGGTGSFTTLLSEAKETESYLEVCSWMSGDTDSDVLSVIDIYAHNGSTGSYTDAYVYIFAETENAGEAFVIIGNDTTDEVGFADADLDTSTLGWSKDYLSLCGDSSVWEAWDAIYGSSGSILLGIVLAEREVLYIPSGVTPLTSSSGVLAVDAEYGNSFNVSVTESLSSITFSNMCTPMGTAYYGRKIKLRFVFGGSYTVPMSAFSGGLFASGASDISGTSGDVYVVHVDELGSGKRYCRIEGPYTA